VAIKESNMEYSFTEKIKQVLKRIPRGKVATYGQIAVLAGNPLGARQVAWTLHSCAEKYNLPWQRVIGSKGKISLPKRGGYELQKKLLVREGVKFGKGDLIDLDRYLWEPRKRKAIKRKQRS
jgi:methylated-DNA-protein-cysteine methyltransferase related protein